MVNSGKSKKLIFIIAVLLSLILAFSSYTTSLGSTAVNGFTLPCTIETYGKAWNGVLAFDLEGNTSSYLVVMDTNGAVLRLREFAGTNGFGPTYEIAPDTLFFEGPAAVNIPTAWPTWQTGIWNLGSNTTESFPEVVSEHDAQYDPVNNTFLVLQDYLRQIGNNTILFDRIVQVNATGSVLWTWDTYNHIPLSEASPFNETVTFNGNETVEDFTHANTLDWDYQDSIIYLNLRNTNTFYAINQTTGDIIWACGEFGNFTLLGSNGQPLPTVNGLPPSLWYHCHDLQQIAPNVFTMFDNDYNNNSNPDDCHSSMKEITLNFTSMTAQVTWSWEAPKQYWTTYGGATVQLPNGDWIGDFGDPNHQLSQNQPWNFTNTGAVFIEVNAAGKIMRTFTFPVGWYVYRIDALTNLTFPVTLSVASLVLPITVSATVAAVVIVGVAIALKRKKSLKNFEDSRSEGRKS